MQLGRMKALRMRACVGLGLAMTLGSAHASAQQQPQPPAGVYIVQTAPPPAAAPAQAPTAVEGPRVITDWEEGEPIPRGYHPAERARKGLIVGGAVTFGVMYFITLLVAAANSDSASKSGTSSPTDALYVPAIGPFIQMTKSSSATANVFLLIDGIAQTGGVVMFIAGFTLPKAVLLRDADSGKPKLVAAPLVGPGMSGLGIIGRF